MKGENLVHYVLRDGQHRPALITAFGKEKGKANLIVLLDADDMGWDTQFKQTPQDMSVTFEAPFYLKAPNISQDEDEKEPGTWHNAEKAPVVMTDDEKDKKEEKDPASKIINDPPDKDSQETQMQEDDNLKGKEAAFTEDRNTPTPSQEAFKDDVPEAATESPDAPEVPDTSKAADLPERGPDDHADEGEEDKPEAPVAKKKAAATSKKK